MAVATRLEGDGDSIVPLLLYDDDLPRCTDERRWGSGCMAAPATPRTRHLFQLLDDRTASGLTRDV